MQFPELACSSFLRLSSSQEFRSACYLKLSIKLSLHPELPLLGLLSESKINAILKHLKNNIYDVYDVTRLSNNTNKAQYIISGVIMLSEIGKLCHIFMLW